MLTHTTCTGALQLSDTLEEEELSRLTKAYQVKSFMFSIATVHWNLSKQYYLPAYFLEQRTPNRFVSFFDSSGNCSDYVGWPHTTDGQAPTSELTCLLCGPSIRHVLRTSVLGFYCKFGVGRSGGMPGSSPTESGVKVL